MLEIKQLQYFISCVEEGSLSKAAEVLYTSQPNVSKIIGEMENELGLKLFDRMGKGIRPTEEGKILYQHALEILYKEQAIMDFSKTHKRHHLRITYNISNSISKIISEYWGKREANLDLTVRDGDTERVISDVEKHCCDIGFAYILDSQFPAFRYNLSRKNLLHESIWQKDLYFLVGEKNKLHSRETISLREITEERFVRNSDDFFSIENGLCIVESKLRPALSQAVVTDSVYLQRTLIKNTNMANIAAPAFFKEDISDGIKMIKIAPEIKVDLVAVYREPPKGEDREFIDFVIKKARESEVYG